MGSRTYHTDQALKFIGLQDLKKITNNYSLRLGHGAYGTVFKGKDECGKDIAVKRFPEMRKEDHEEAFKNEYFKLLGLCHPNVIQLVGYCYETGMRADSYTQEMEDVILSALCFEFVPKSLRSYILSVEDCENTEKADLDPRLDWHGRYKIIKGTVEGLNYLHNLPSGCICHFDLKPENILLNDDMTAKIADFGMARLLVDLNSHVTTSPLGTFRYVPPEFKNDRKFSNKFDIYSLGVIIIELVAGPREYNSFNESFRGQEDTLALQKVFIDRVHAKWSHILPEEYWEQLTTCIQMALRCVKTEPTDRPDITEIINSLNTVENVIEEKAVSKESPSRCPVIQRVDSTSTSAELPRAQDGRYEMVIQRVDSTSTEAELPRAQDDRDEMEQLWWALKRGKTDIEEQLWWALKRGKTDILPILKPPPSISKWRKKFS